MIKLTFLTLGLILLGSGGGSIFFERHAEAKDKYTRL